MPVTSTPTRTSRRKKIVAATLVLLLLIALPAWYVFGRTDRSHTVHADFEYVNGIYVGSTVAVLGVEVGTVTDIEPQGTSVRVTMTVPDEVTLPEDVSAYVMSPAIISERYVELGPAYDGGPTFADGGVIPKDRSHSPIDIDNMLDSLSTIIETMGPDNADLGAVLTSGADVWEGRGAAFHDAIADLAAATGVVGASTEDFALLVENLSTLLRALDERSVGLDSMVTDLSALAAVWEESDLDVTEPLQQLQVVFDEVDTFVAQHQESFGAISDNLKVIGDTLGENPQGLAEFMDLVPLMMENLTDTIGPDGRGRIRLNISTALTQFAVAAPLCAEHPLPLCTGAGFTNPISFPISASDPLGIVSAVTGGQPGGNP
ncbi:MCE family protein [Rhodococcus rhodochrous]|uniref:Phospholipid/cholesterol/gamma-HCH transport system substrate-binding protein n=1 Tax=Rhodococcus rhodochrous J45 TaxID=935266 RepID=A0A562E4F1_RHORH|nr:virulence factor Mce [Rhodococcus sp. BUPNP1]TWH16926.1 phospholipid/cholesterol/gamma-HCH transport system substrate-binding protein [Rhodococcus rhodochrous J45]